MLQSPVTRAYEILTAEDDGRVCRDIPEALCDEQPGNFFRHVLSLSATKTGDGLADPKLVLAWLLGALGAPAWQIGLLVPVREAGALLPQLATSAWIRQRSLRKRVWAAASVGQGLAVGGMAATALLLEGALAGGAIVGCLAVFALSRSAASVSYKDVLGKTISKATRGKVTGASGSIASALVLTFGVLVSLDVLPLEVDTIVAALVVAAGLWIVAAALFMTLAEHRGATGGGGRPLDQARSQVGLLRTDRQLARFITVRGLLLATALAPPYILSLAGTSGPDRLGDLGPFVIASAAAAVTSAWFWGGLADRSSRRVLVAASVIAALVLGSMAVLALSAPGFVERRFVLPVGLFLLMVAYQGVRVGRSTHLVDMATEEVRAAYVALSNTAIGILLLVTSAFGLVAEALGLGAVLAAFAGLCVLAAVAAQGLEEVQRRPDDPDNDPAA